MIPIMIELTLSNGEKYLFPLAAIAGIGCGTAIGIGAVIDLMADSKYVKESPADIQKLIDAEVKRMAGIMVAAGLQIWRDLE